LGLEKTCDVVVGGKKTTATVQLEPGAILVRGPLGMKIPLAEVGTFEAKGGVLHLTWGKETLRLALGADASKWALKIRYPRGRLDKLGIKSGMRVAVIGVADAGFRQELAERTDDVTAGEAPKDTDVVVVGMSARRDLAKLRGLRSSIKKNGAIWVVWPKGRKEFREDDIRAHGLAIGLVDVKVVSFSDTLSGLKMVIPVKERGR
jgi:hypothetical protein